MRINRISIRRVVLGCLLGLTISSFAQDESAVKEQPDYRYGVQVIWDRRGGTGEIPDKLLARALMLETLDLGATIVRIGVNWASLEEKQGEIQWEKTDPLVDMLVENNMPILACFCTTPYWASALSPEQKKVFEDRGWEALIGVTPPHKRFVEEFRQYAETCAARYRGKIDLYEFWNEEEGMGMPIPFENDEGKWDIKVGGVPAIYTYWLKEAYTAIKKGNPDARVAIGGMESPKENRFLRALLEEGAAGYFDAVCLHPYGRPDTDYELDWAWVEDTQRVLDEHGLPDIPIWITEYGWLVQYKPGGINESRQASLLRKTFEQVQNYPRVELMTFHTLNDWGGGVDKASTMGLMNWLGEHRMAFEVFQEAAAAQR
jgi:GH35 family endo-1,4-beta-xylanase